MTEGAKRDTEEQAEYRVYCRDWLKDNIPPRPTIRLPQGPLEIMTTDQFEYLCACQKSAYDAGLIGSDYPVEYGGGGRNNCQKGTDK
jgi:hypothetical protein